MCGVRAVGDAEHIHHIQWRQAVIGRHLRDAEAVVGNIPLKHRRAIAVAGSIRDIEFPVDLIGVAAGDGAAGPSVEEHAATLKRQRHTCGVRLVNDCGGEPVADIAGDDIVIGGRGAHMQVPAKVSDWVVVLIKRAEMKADFIARLAPKIHRSINRRLVEAA